jgi:hypothetical protein
MKSGVRKTFWNLSRFVCWEHLRTCEVGNILFNWATKAGWRTETPVRRWRDISFKNYVLSLVRLELATLREPKDAAVWEWYVVRWPWTCTAHGAHFVLFSSVVSTNLLSQIYKCRWIVLFHVRWSLLKSCAVMEDKTNAGNVSLRRSEKRKFSLEELETLSREVKYQDL